MLLRKWKAYHNNLPAPNAGICSHSVDVDKKWGLSLWQSVWKRESCFALAVSQLYLWSEVNNSLSSESAFNFIPSAWKGCTELSSQILFASGALCTENLYLITFCLIYKKKGRTWIKSKWNLQNWFRSSVEHRHPFWVCGSYFTATCKEKKLDELNKIFSSTLFCLMKGELLPSFQSFFLS